MKENLKDINIIDTPLSCFDKVIEALLILLLAFMPLAFGVVEAWSEEVVIILAAAISIVFLLKLIFEKNTSIVFSWTYIPIALFILIPVFQLIALPDNLATVISANTVTTKKELLDDLPNSVALLKSMPLTFYPNATKHDLRLVLAIGALFFVVLNVYRRPDQIKRLLGAIAVIGGSIAVLALAQDLFGNGKIYWFVLPEGGKANSGTFVNHSHYGQFMNLSIGAALGLIMVKLHEAFTRNKVTPAFVVQYLGSFEAKAIWILLAIIILGAATIFVSLTRGGMISMLIAAGFTTLIISSRKSLRGRGWIILLMVLGAFICILYLGFDAVYDRLGTLQEMHNYEGRWQLVKDTATAWTKFPALGTGLGTHEIIYPMFGRLKTAGVAVYAENEYVQALEETGAIGFIMLVTFGIIVWFKYFRNTRSSSTPIKSAAYGLGFGLLAIMIHSLSDFGQHLPANAVLSAIFCALLLSLGQFSKPVRGFRKISISILVCISVVWIWAIVDSNNARLAEAAWQKVTAVEQLIHDKGESATDEDYKELISNAMTAVDFQPDNIKYHHGLNVYRWCSLSRTTDIDTGEIIIPKKALDFVQRIVDELNNARILCPTYGATYCVVGQLEKNILNNPNAADLIKKGYQLAPNDPTACFVAGLLDIEDNQITASFDKFSKAIELDWRFFREAANIYINHVDRPDLAIALAGDNSTWLSYVANALVNMQEHADIFEQARARITELLKEKCAQPDAPAAALVSLARFYKKEGDNEAAIENYRRALMIEYDQVQWRFSLAKLFAETGRIKDAIYEARICLRIRPQFDSAKDLIAELSVLPAPDNILGEVQQP